MNKPKYKRILLKISGEALAGSKGTGIDLDVLGLICDEIKKVWEMGVQTALVIGSGNIWRGRFGKGMDRTTADHMGMLATIINALALQDALEARGLSTRVQTAIEVKQIAESYIKRRAVRHLEKGRIVIFAAGTGNPFFSTDTAAALRAAEIGADIVLLGKKIDGVYSRDPQIDFKAKRYDSLSYMDILDKNLGVMDSTAASLCRDNRIPILVFGLDDPQNIQRAVRGEKIGTIIK